VVNNHLSIVSKGLAGKDKEVGRISVIGRAIASVQ